ncbi:DUF1700 domain-containing protein [Bacillus velezensis]|uniref:HAAS signaling domain-containing protein n=1 Tax=Bacillus velezensis TaxID=492670 RepID=UPI001E40C5E3|nr:DUF1700 domain-containing protein [Bacillus velezensis]MCD7911089.1 DUF1700 domain-containing protein [Bacillus velezensis]
MLKSEYLKKLKPALKKLPRHEQKEILNDIEEAFIIGMSSGRSEQEVSRHLGNPQILAKTLVADSIIQNSENENSIQRFFQIFMQVLGISFFNFFFTLCPFILVASILTSLFALSIMSIGASFIVVPRSFFNALIILGFGIILLQASIDLIKLFVRFFLKYIAWTVSLVRRKKINEEMAL